MSFPTRALGRNGPQVSSIGLGTMSLAGAYGPEKTQEEKFEVFDRAHAVGARFWDSANVYGDSEKCIGEWFKRTGKRDDIFLATKVGLQVKDRVRVECTEPNYIKEACCKSLETLGIETIDLLYLQRIDNVTPIEKTIAAMVELKNEGKIRYIGLSECSAATLRRASAVHQISAYEVEYSPFSLEIESDDIGVLAACRENGIAIVAYSPIGRGVLTGRIASLDDLPENDSRRLFPKYSTANFPKINQLVDKLKQVAAVHNCSAAQACIAWVMAQGDDIIPIPGTKTIKYLEENVAAARVQLTEREVAELRECASAMELSGTRYPAAMMDAVFRDSAPMAEL